MTEPQELQTITQQVNQEPAGLAENVAGLDLFGLVWAVIRNGLDNGCVFTCWRYDSMSAYEVGRALELKGIPFWVLIPCPQQGLIAVSVRRRHAWLAKRALQDYGCAIAGDPTMRRRGPLDILFSLFR